MRKDTGNLATAFVMGTMGMPPVGGSAAETQVGEDGLAAQHAMAVYIRMSRALAEIDLAHPELGIHDEMVDVINEIRGNGNVADALARMDALAAKARPFLPE